MLKPRTLFRLGVGLVALLAALIVVIAAWPQGPPTPEAIAQRGKSPPRKDAWSDTSFSVSAVSDWIDEGMDAWNQWDRNPWKTKIPAFTQRADALKYSRSEADKAKYQQLLELSRKWHANLLARFPELAFEPRKVPAERNMLRSLVDLNKRQQSADGNLDLTLPDNIRAQLIHSKPWDASAAQAWLDANQGLVQEIRVIAMMPDASRYSVEDESIIFSRYCSDILLMDAMQAVGRGDVATALASLQAVSNLGDRLKSTSYLIDTLVGGAIQNDARNCMLLSLLPALPSGQIRIEDWEAALHPSTHPPAEFAQMMRAEWNGMTQTYLLPALSDSSDPSLPSDPEALVEAYTRHMLAIVNQNEPLTLADLPDDPSPAFDAAGLSYRSRKIAADFGQITLRNTWMKAQLQSGLTQAAFAILKGEPVPNDPIYGKPYSWNPETRELGMPTGPEFRKMSTRPITLPKLTR